MGRIRSLKPEFPQSQSMGRVSRDARLLFIQLWTVCDDSGRARAASRMLASLLYPYDDDAPKLIDRWLDELSREGCIRRYRVGSDDYLEVCNWDKHQKIDKPSKSKFPAFDEASRGVDEPSRTFVVGLDQGLDQGSGIEYHPKTVADAPGFESFWQAYDKKVGRLAATKAWRKLAPDAALVERIVAAAKTSARLRPDKQFRKDPSGWLNGKHWEDEAIEAAPSTNASGRPVVEASRIHMQNMPLGSPYCQCGECTNFRNKKQLTG